MTTTEVLLACIWGMLVVLWIYVRRIYLRLEYGKLFDPSAPTNQYGEGLSEGIQNAIVRGNRGIYTHEQ
jgi:hypothetical protein